MTQPPLVSIALCTYNGANYLTEQLDTLVSQSYQHIEIIVVDDCSSDETFSILTAYAAKYHQFKVYQNERNLGFTSNFERAVSLSSGELIALCDQDDIWHLQKIELQVEAIGDNVFIYHDSEFIYQDGTSMDKKMSDLMNLYKGGNPGAFLFFNCVSGHAVLMKRQLLDHALPLKKDYFHDWWLAYVATNIGTIDFIPQCLVQYRQHEKSETNILRLERNKDLHKQSSVKKIERIYQWLHYCAVFPQNKNQQMIAEFYQAFTIRMNSYVSIKLCVLLFKYREIIFAIRKKSKINRLNYIYSQVWGLKTKKLFS